MSIGRGVAAGVRGAGVWERVPAAGPTRGGSSPLGDRFLFGVLGLGVELFSTGPVVRGRLARCVSSSSDGAFLWMVGVGTTSLWVRRG